MSREILDISGYSDSQRLTLSQELLASPIVDKERNLDIIETTPLAGNLPFPVSLQKMLAVHQANEFLPEISPLVLETVSVFLLLEEPEPQNIDVLIENLKKKTDPKRAMTISFYPIEMLLGKPDSLGFPKEQSRIAISHMGVVLAAKLFKSETDEKAKMTWLSFVFYFAAFECLYSGIQTNASLFAMYPETVDSDLIEEILPLMSVANEEEAKKARTGYLFEGHSVSPLKDLGDGKLYFYLGRRTE